MSNKFKFLDFFEYLLGLMAIISLFSLVNLNMSLEIRDPDIWLHLKSGEYIFQHRTIPGQDIFSSTLAGKTWIDHSWLVQVIFYLVFHFGGANNLIYLSALIVTIAFLCLFLSVYQRPYFSLSVVILLVTILASRIRFNIRPENFSILFFSLYLFLLTRQSKTKGLFFLPLIQLFWVNSHGFFILGVVVVGIFILAEQLKRTGLLPWEWASTDFLDKQAYRNLSSVFALVCLASLINPYWVKGALYPLGVSFRTMGKSSIFYKYILELLPTWHFHYKLIASYYLLGLISLLSFILNFRRINLAYLLLYLFFLGISLGINRNIIYFNFVAFFTTLDNLIRFWQVKRSDFLKVFLGKSVYLLRCIIIAGVIFFASRINYGILKANYYLFPENRFKGLLLGINLERFPYKAADFILENNLPENLFNLFNDGSYLIYRLFPKKKVFIDGRTELYGDDFFKNYQRVLHVDKPAIDETVKKYNINTVLLSESIQYTDRLARYFFTQPDWVLVYLDENSLIFLKNNPQNAVLIDKLKMDLKKCSVPKMDLDKIGIKNIYPEPYIKRAWIFYYLGFPEVAIQEAKEALRISPSVSDAYTIMAKIYTEQKLYELAFETLRLGYIYSPFKKTTLLSLGNFYLETAKFSEALKTYQRLIKFYPGFAEGYYFLAKGYLEIGNLKLAIKALQRAIRLDPFEPGYYKELGELLYKNKDFKAAIKIYEAALALNLEPQDFLKRLEAVLEALKKRN